MERTLLSPAGLGSVHPPTVLHAGGKSWSQCVAPCPLPALAPQPQAHVVITLTAELTPTDLPRTGHCRMTLLGFHSCSPNDPGGPFIYPTSGRERTSPPRAWSKAHWTVPAVSPLGPLSTAGDNTPFSLSLSSLHATPTPVAFCFWHVLTDPALSLCHPGSWESSSLLVDPTRGFVIFV